MFKKAGTRIWTFLFPNDHLLCCKDGQSQKMMHMGTKKAKNPYV